ncbi:MAG TPA: hypothetical protein VFJ30_14130 [Phycisphaerae bacterium]|nr:hypothetical protein [Phycisphaerae bacterium]
MSAGRASLPAVFLGAVSTILVVLGVWAWQDYRSNAPLPAQAVLSRPQMAAVAEGVKSYEAANGRRPARLEELLAGGHVKPADLFDSRRKVDRAIDPETGRFLATPDVLYFPGIEQEKDASDLVLLCTLFTERRDGHLLAVFSDYRLVELEPRELVAALNRTYTRLAEKRDDP